MRFIFKVIDVFSFYNVLSFLLRRYAMSVNFPSFSRSEKPFWYGWKDSWYGWKFTVYPHWFGDCPTLLQHKKHVDSFAT